MKYANLQADKAVGDYKWNHQALLGAGAFGKVYLGKDKNDKMVAIKVMSNKELADPYLQQALKNELDILKMLKGPNVSGMLDQYQTQNNTYIVQPFADGGDLRGYLTKKGQIPEQEAVHIFSQLLSGYKELVSHNLIHRDLKPENSLINNGVNMISDYGFGRVVQDYKNQKLTTGCGTPCYMAPQLLQNKPYTTKSDVWSMGIIYFEILYATLPWDCRSQDDLVRKSTTIPVRFPSTPAVSAASKDFIKGCLQPDESKRFNWDQVFSHSLWQGAVKVDERSAQQQSSISQDSRSVLVKLQEIIAKDNINVQDLFSQFDKSGNHTLDATEFYNIFATIDASVQRDQTDKIFKSLDIDGSGFLSFAEFQANVLETNYAPQENAMLQEQKAKRCLKKLRDVINEHHIDIMVIFKNFDKSSDSALDKNEFCKVLQAVDDQISLPESNLIFYLFDKDKSGTISPQEFIAEVKSQNVTALEEQFKNIQLSKPMSEEGKRAIVTLRSVVQQHQLDPRQIFAQFDKDQSNSLDIGEFTKMIRVIASSLSSSEIQNVFSNYNSDGGSVITVDEFLHIFG